MVNSENVIYLRLNNLEEVVRKFRTVCVYAFKDLEFEDDSIICTGMLNSNSNFLFGLKSSNCSNINLFFIRKGQMLNTDAIFYPTTFMELKSIIHALEFISNAKSYETFQVKNAAQFIAKFSKV